MNNNYVRTVSWLLSRRLIIPSTYTKTFLQPFSFFHNCNISKYMAKYIVFIDRYLSIFVLELFTEYKYQITTTSVDQLL